MSNQNGDPETGITWGCCFALILDILICGVVYIIASLFAIKTTIPTRAKFNPMMLRTEFTYKCPECGHEHITPLDRLGTTREYTITCHGCQKDFILQLS